MPILTVGPNSMFPSIAAAMRAGGPGDTIVLESGYSNEAVTVLHNGMTITGDATSTGIILQLGSGIATFSLGGGAPFEVRDAPDGNGIVGNAGDNLITVTGGSDAVDGGAGVDRLVIDYRLALGAVTGDSTSNFTEAGAGGRMVTVVDGTIEHFTVLTGSGADTITTGGGDDIIETGEGAGTVTAGQGFNRIIGGSGADTFTGLDGGNYMDGGDGKNVLTTGGGRDTILSGTGADTIVAGAGDDRVTVRGGADTSDGGAGDDVLVIDYSAMVTNISGGVSSGNLAAGFTGRLADLDGASIDFVGTETFIFTGGGGSDTVTTGGGADTLNGGAGDDVLAGGGGADTLSGGDGRDTLDGGDGDDLLAGGAGSADTLLGGGGADTVTYAGASRGVIVDLDVQLTWDGTLNDTLGSVENVIGTAFDDIFFGSSADNILDGGAGGRDDLRGYGGNDTVSYASSDRGVIIDLDAQITSDGLVQDTLQSIENARGSGFNDIVFGSSGDNRIEGGSGSDQLNGYAGADTLLGGADADVLSGGAGADRFVFTALTDSRVQARDRISDFNAADGDLIDLSAIDADLTLAGDQAFSFVSNFTGVAGQALLSFDGAANRTTLQLDQNGDGVADFSLLIDGAVGSGSGFVV